MKNYSAPKNQIAIIIIMMLLTGFASSVFASEKAFRTSVFESELSISSTSNYAQDSTILYKIETRDGNEYIGEIVEQDAEKIILNTKSLGTITIQKINMVSMELVDPARLQQGVYWADHMQSTRYFWQPSGYGLKKGEGYYQNVWILFNQFSVGVSDKFLIGGGIIPLFLFNGISTPVWVTPKFSIPIQKDKLNIGVGGLFATVLGESGANFGIAYGTMTLGSKDHNASFGVGYGYAGSDWAKTPTFSFSMLQRTGPKGYFVTENYFIGTDSDFVILSMIGGRRIIGRHAGLDFGLVLPINTGADIFIAIPWLGITLPFGNVP